MTDIGDELRRAIADRSLSLRATARLAGCSAGYLSNVIHGRKPLTPSVAARLDKTLGTADTFTSRALSPLTSSESEARENPASLGSSAPEHDSESGSWPGAEVSASWPGADHGTGDRSLQFPVGEAAHARSGGAISRSAMAQTLELIPRASVVPMMSVLNEILLGYVRADRLMGSLTLTGPVCSHAPLVERVCEAARGADRMSALSFASRFMEFCGWVHQDAGDLACAMRWTDRGLAYALELGDQRVIAYTLMRKAAIATEAGLPRHGLGMANVALATSATLTPRLRAVILRQRAFACAVLGDAVSAAKDAEAAIVEAIAGVSQGEEDRAPYCSPMYVAMEAGAVQMRIGNATAALPILEQSRSAWSETGQARDYALCLSRLAVAHAMTGAREQANGTARDATIAAQGVGSRRVASQLVRLRRILGRWGEDSHTAETLRQLTALTGQP
jgi:transcriptional regulator with XRE-family HTH domain